MIYTREAAKKHRLFTANFDWRLRLKTEDSKK